MLNKQTIWTIVIISIILIGAVTLFNNSIGDETDDLGPVPDEDFADIETSDDVFAEIDSAIDFIDN
tara:strand:+ start:432 stop:629 length:198 start_codon:yes stop_codon:yes gene_type:complete